MRSSKKGKLWEGWARKCVSEEELEELGEDNERKEESEDRVGGQGARTKVVWRIR